MKIVMILFLSFLVVSCGKKNQIKVTAKNAATGEGFADLGFRIFEVKPYTTPTGEVQELVYEGNFNANGEAVADIRLKNRSYVITTVSPGPMCYINNTQYFFHRDDDNLKFDFLFAPCAYLKLKIENVNCEEGGDLMNFRQRQSFTKWSGWSSDRVGCYFYESPNYQEVPSGWRIYEWVVDRDGTITSHKDSIFLTADQEHTFEINY